MDKEIEVLKTFDQWRELGARIKAGSRAVAKNSDGVPLFSSHQVWYPAEDKEEDFDFNPPKEAF